MNLFENTDNKKNAQNLQDFKLSVSSEGHWNAGVQFEPIEKPKKEAQVEFLFQVREEMMASNSLADSMIKF